MARQTRNQTLEQLWGAMRPDRHYTAYELARVIQRTPQYTRQLLNELWRNGLIDAYVNQPTHTHRMGYCTYALKGEK